MKAKRRERRFYCPVTGKVQHDLKEDAYRAAFWDSRDTFKPGKVTVYQCQHCKGWHWGHTKR